MAKRKTGVQTGKRYEKLLSDPRHRPKKTRNTRRFDKVVNLVVLGAIVYGGIYLIPKRDKEEFAELLGELPADLAAVKAPLSGTTETASLSSVLASFIPEIPEPPVAIRDTAATAAEPEAQPATRRPAPAGGLLSLNDFPRAYDNWRRTEFETAETAAQALREMDGFLDSRPVEMARDEALRDRKAALYEDGANLRFLIVVEASRQMGSADIIAATAEPAPAVMMSMPSALSEPRAEQSVNDTPSGRSIARARIGGAGRRSVELAGISFIDHAADPTRDLVDLRARLPGDRAIYVRGRAPLTVIEDFLSRADLSSLGLHS